jgi:phosphotransferase system HPr (HPr) family protein
VNGASILSILALACPRGTEIEVKTLGEDAEALMEALSRLFEQKFGEGK